MKKRSIILLLMLLILSLTGCQQKSENLPGAVGPAQTEEQPAAIDLATLPDTKDLAFTVEGTNETITTAKAMHDNFYAMYYDAERFAYVPGEILDTGFSDAFISLYDDESTTIMTTMKVCYTANTTPEQWIANTVDTEWAPQQDLDASSVPSWEASEQTASLGQDNLKFQLWTSSDAVGATNLCYTIPFRGGCFAVVVSYPQEAAEGWGVRMDTMIKTLVLAAE